MELPLLNLHHSRNDAWIAIYNVDIHDFHCHNRCHGSSPKILKLYMHTLLLVPSRIPNIGQASRMSLAGGGIETVEDVGGSATGAIACSSLYVSV